MLKSLLTRLPPGWVKPRLYHLLSPLAALAVFGILREIPWGRELVELVENQSVNVRFKMRADFDPPADPRIVFLGIDQSSLDKFKKYPWRRTIIADFLTNMAKADVAPNVLTFDIFYTEPSSDPADDQALGNAAGLLPNVITGALADPAQGSKESIQAKEEDTRNILANLGLTSPLLKINGNRENIRSYSIAEFPVQPLRDQSCFGFVNDDPSPVDDIRHTVPLVVRVDDQFFPSLALQTLCKMLGVDADNVTVNLGQNVILKDFNGKTWTIPINEKGEYTINYRSNDSFALGSLPFVRLATALEDYLHSPQDHPLPPWSNLKKRIVVIGETATGLVDLGPTPISARSPLPYVHLNVLNNVLQQDYLTFVPWYWVLLGWLLVTWPTLLRLKVAPLTESIAAPLTAVAIYHLIAFGIFWKWSIEIALTWPVIGYTALNFGGVVMRWREEQRGKEQIKRVFSQMLSPEVMGHLLDHPENLKLGGSERSVTILFSDIRDYTKFSEGLAPAEVVRQLNVYFTRMVGCVNDYGGTLHKFIGDAIMVAWGDIEVASEGPEKDAQNAVRSALMMRRKLRELNEERRTEGLLPLRIGIGLNHGDDVLVGLIGAASRTEFTVMGDPVNVASRLEGITKEFHTDVAISESVRDLLGDGFLVRRLGFIQLKGKTQATVVFEVLGEKSDPAQSKMTPEAVARYEEAFDHFLARRFTEAEAAFLACEKLSPGDFCVDEYLKASREFTATPPPSDWDGRIVMKTK